MLTTRSFRLAVVLLGLTGIACSNAVDDGKASEQQETSVQNALDACKSSASVDLSALRPVFVAHVPIVNPNSHACLHSVTQHWVPMVSGLTAHSRVLTYWWQDEVSNVEPSTVWPLPRVPPSHADVVPCHFVVLVRLPRARSSTPTWPRR